MYTILCIQKIRILIKKKYQPFSATTTTIVHNKLLYKPLIYCVQAPDQITLEYLAAVLTSRK